jgi:hypothetical protein
VKQVLPRGEVWHQWEGGGFGERVRRVNMMQKCIHMYVNAKIIPVKTIPGIGGGVGNEGEW